MKKIVALFMIYLLMLPPSYLWANPQGGSVAAGSVAIHTAPGVVTVNQSSGAAIVNWNSFSVNSGELTKFVQPGSSSAILNRVTGGSTSFINGTIEANGQVFLMNQNGVLIGSQGVINAAGFAASTRDIADTDFMSGSYRFTGNSESGVTNLGKIEALDGDVTLIGHTVSNAGTINAAKGSVNLAAGDDVLLSLGGDQRIFINAGTTSANAKDKTAISNTGSITATQAELRAANGNAYAFAIQNEGTIRASTVTKQGGRVFLTSESGGIRNSGKIDASAEADGGEGGYVYIKTDAGKMTNTAEGEILAKNGAGGKGGFIETSGEEVSLSGSILAGDGGLWLIDPLTYDSTVIQNSTLVGQLNIGDITYRATSTMTLTNDLTWTGGGVLTLQNTSTTNGITLSGNITAANGGLILDATGGRTITATGNIAVKNFTLSGGDWVQSTASLPSFSASNSFSISSGGSFLRVAGGNGEAATPYQIADVYGLQGIGYSTTLLSKNYKQTRNIDASSTVTWNSGAGFSPIGTDSVNTFKATYDGGRFTISGLTIDRPNTNTVGLFGSTANGSVLKNIGLVGGSVTGRNEVGGLSGSSFGSVSNSYTTGAVTGLNSVGGLVGAAVLNASVSNSYATGAVKGSLGSVGGLVGSAGSRASVSNSYATGAVTGFSKVGGLVGEMYGDVSTSYATGAVTGSAAYVGGLVGFADFSASVSNSYATGAVKGLGSVGGLVGWAGSRTSVSNSYTTGVVTGLEFVGGLVGLADGGIVRNSYWDINTTKQSNAVGSGTPTNVVGVDSSTAYKRTTYANFGTAIQVSAGDSNAYKLGDNWVILDGDTRPMLAWEVSANGTARSDGSYAVKNGHELQLTAFDLSKNYTQTQNIDLTSELSNASGVWNTTTGFTPIGIEGNPFTGTYDGGNFTISGLTIDRPRKQFLGLFGYAASGSALKNIGLIDGSVKGFSFEGGFVGALVGQLDGTVSNSYATGNVSGFVNVGGLVGGVHYERNREQQLATGAVKGFLRVGGLVGYTEGAVGNSYATGNVNGTSNVGALVGVADGNISNSYATGAVTGSSNVGGLVGDLDEGVVTKSYWAKDAGTGLNSGLSGIGNKNSNTGATPKTLAELKQASTYASSWDFTPGTGIWGVNGVTKNGQINNGLPFFQWQYPVVASFKANNQTVQYGDSLNSTQYTATYASGYNQTNVLGSGASPTLTLSGGNVNAGTTNVINITATPASTLADNQAVTFSTGIETISKRQITVSANNLGTSTYGDTVTFTNNAQSQLLSGDTLGGSLIYKTDATVSDAGFYNKGDWKYSLTLSGYNDNYAVSYGAEASFKVSAKGITVSAVNLGTSTYGESVTFTNNGKDQVLFGDTLGGLATYTTNATTSKAGFYSKGDYTYNLTLAGYNDNYAVTIGNDARFSVSPKGITVSAVNLGASTYGESVTFTNNGKDQVLLGDTLGGIATYTTNATTSKAGFYDKGDYTYTLTLAGYNDNYAVTIGNDASFSVNAKTISTVTLNGSVSKIYDGTDSVNTTDTGYGSLGITSSDILSADSGVTFATTGYTYGSKNKGAGLSITSGALSLIGVGSGNYKIASGLTSVSNNNGTINAKTLLYVADAKSRFAGEGNPAFSGKVTGFVAGEGIKDATSGTLLFSSLANASSAAGRYAIVGSGLTSLNYEFEQAPSNATALTVEDLQAGVDFEVPPSALSDTFKPLGGLNFGEGDSPVSRPFTLVAGGGSLNDGDSNQLARSSSFTVPE